MGLDLQAGLEKVSSRVQGQMEVLREHVVRLKEVQEEVKGHQVHRGVQLELFRTPPPSCDKHLMFTLVHLRWLWSI